LNYGLGFVLGFVGLKMLAEAVPCGSAGVFCSIPEHGDGHIAIPIWLSLIVIVTALTLTTVLSLVIPPPEEGPELPRAGGQREVAGGSEKEEPLSETDRETSRSP
ncbi:MAG: hypothetical protein M3280_05525, partial [Actinomycetota bacterium]|nr:hypothetical protein [Actinomycetota bacterium]